MKSQAPRLREKRVSITASAVSRALGDLADDIPVACLIEDVADQIVANEIMDSDIQNLPQAYRDDRCSKVTVELKTNGMFKRGCSQYSRESMRPHALVTSYLFEVVLGQQADRGLMELLATEALSEHDVMCSLPGAPVYAGLSEDNNDPIVARGEHVGVVIFPADSQSPLLEAAERRDNLALRQNVGTQIGRTSVMLDPGKRAELFAASKIVQDAINICTPSPKYKKEA